MKIARKHLSILTAHNDQQNGTIHKPGFTILKTLIQIQTDTGLHRQATDGRIFGDVIAIKGERRPIYLCFPVPMFHGTDVPRFLYFNSGH